MISLPAPDGALQRFAIMESPIMEADLAAAHPEISTYSGVGIDDPTATLRADTTPLGFHASVRSARGAWYIDPYYHLDTSTYVSYYARDAKPARRRARPTSEDVLDAEPGDASAPAAAAGPDVTLRTYRLALVTDPTYATYFGAANVTAAKVTLMNRVDQIYEDELAIRMVLINQTDKLNLNTAADMTERGGPCGGPACYTAFQAGAGCSGPLLKRNQIVIGQIIGASNYDIGHIALGINGGGIAQLGIVGRGAKAWGCTGLPTPVGDFMAVDYVAHEMGHQFAGNHTFNGTQLNCSGANRNGRDVGRAGLGLVDHGLRGHLPPGQPAAALGPVLLRAQLRRDHQLHVDASAPAKDEVQLVSLIGFDTNGDSFRLSYGRATTVPIVRGGNYTVAGITAALQAIMPAGATVTVQPWAGRDEGNLLNVGFQVEFGGTFAGLDLEALGFTGTGVTGMVGESVKGGAVQNRGFFITPTGNHAPEVTTAPAYTIPLRTPFALTGSATDADNDALTYMWEQNDVGGATGTALVNNVKRNGPLFRQFGVAAQVTRDGHAALALAGREHDDGQPDPRVPGHGADPGREHQRGHRRLPGRAHAGHRPGAAGDRGLLQRVPADRRLGRRARRPHAELPPHRA